MSLGRCSALRSLPRGKYRGELPSDGGESIDQHGNGVSTPRNPTHTMGISDETSYEWELRRSTGAPYEG